MRHTTTGIEFFVPNDRFDEWIQSYLSKNTAIVDCGCGEGHVVKHLNDLGYSKSFGLDVYPGIVNVDCCYLFDATNFSFDKYWMPIICRPYPAEFAVKMILHALKSCGKIIYIGLESHREDHLWTFVTETLVRNIGEDGENAWLIRLAKPKHFNAEYDIIDTKRSI
jgi:hypothetical protein